MAIKNQEEKIKQLKAIAMVFTPYKNVFSQDDFCPAQALPLLEC
jgi:hypothetical protein